MLTDRESFKFGFLLHCADAGLSTEQIQTRIKTAAALVEKQSIVGGGLAKFLTNAGLLGVGAAGVTGLAGGYGLGKMTEKETDPDEVKRQELIATYQQQADRVRRAMRSREYRNASKPRKPRLVA